MVNNFSHNDNHVESILGAGYLSPIAKNLTSEVNCDTFDCSVKISQNSLLEPCQEFDNSLDRALMHRQIDRRDLFQPSLTNSAPYIDVCHSNDAEQGKTIILPQTPTLRDALTLVLGMLNVSNIEPSLNKLMEIFNTEWISTVEDVIELSADQCRALRLPIGLPALVAKVVSHYKDMSRVSVQSTPLSPLNSIEKSSENRLYRRIASSLPLPFAKARSETSDPEIQVFSGHKRQSLKSSAYGILKTDTLSKRTQRDSKRLGSASFTTNPSSCYSNSIRSESSPSRMKKAYSGQPYLKKNSLFLNSSENVWAPKATVFQNKTSWSSVPQYDRKLTSTDLCCFGCGCSLDDCICNNAS